MLPKRTHSTALGKESRTTQPKPIPIDSKKKASPDNRRGLFEPPNFRSLKSYAAVRERAASTNGRYFSLSFIQCAARPFASASLASGKVTKGTRVGPTLQ